MAKAKYTRLFDAEHYCVKGMKDIVRDSMKACTAMKIIEWTKDCAPLHDQSVVNKRFTKKQVLDLMESAISEMPTEKVLNPATAKNLAREFVCDGLLAHMNV